MSILRAVIAMLRSTFSILFFTPGSLFALRQDWPECCRDSDETRRAIESMRSECWRNGI
jgi:hypothetical protein